MKTQEGRGRVWQFQRFLSVIVFAFVCLFIIFFFSFDALNKAVDRDK